MKPNIWTPDSAFPVGSPGILFKIGSYEFHTYSLTMMLGMVAAILTICIFWQREKYKWEILFTLVFITIPSALIGARLWFVVELAIYPNIHPDVNIKAEWYKVWKGGLSIQGGVVVAFVCDLIYVYAKRDLVDIRKACSFIVPTILIGQVIGRWGNYANHELYGRVDWDGSSVLFFGHSFARNLYISDAVSQSYGVVGLYRYPLFLYESLANLCAYLILVWVINWFGLLKPGSSFGLYFVWYGALRLSMEPLRQKALAMYSIASIVFIVLGSLTFLFFQFFNTTHYIRVWRKGRYVYYYAHPEQYIKWIEKTRLFRTKRTKVPLVELKG